MRLRFLALLALVALIGCKSKGAIATLEKADGPVERQEGDKPWGGAKVGTKYFLGDAARTADGAAQLSLAGNARIAMQPHTVLRFGGGKKGSAQIGVELGAIDLVGAGNYNLDVGDVQLKDNGAIRVTAKGKGQSSIELTVGAAQFTAIDGKPVDLEVGKVLDLGIGPVEVVKDAGVVAVPVDAAATPDAAVEISGGAQVEITGKKAEVQQPGDTKWVPLPAGAGSLPKGAKLRLGAGTTAKLVANTTTLELAGGSHITIGDDLIFGLEVGTGKASVPASQQGKVGVPGGSVALSAPADGPAEAKIDVNAKGEAKVTMLRGGGKLDGTGGTALEMTRGESASLAKAGTIHPLEAIPSYFDMMVAVGEPFFTIHDPKGATAVKFDFGGKCAGGGVIEMDHDPHYGASKISGGKDSANLLATPGGVWYYRLRCTVGGSEGPAVASGRLAVVRDDGRRPLPKEPPHFPIDTDGRTYRTGYQSLIPNMKINTPNAGGGTYSLHLATGGTEQTFESDKPSFDVPGTKLKEGTFTYWVEHGGQKSKISTLILEFDQKAAQVYIEAPANGAPWTGDIEIRGATLPGWTAKYDVSELPVDSKNRFHATVQAPAEAKALAIRLSHPKLGTHFYLRRGAK
ncbi:MAG: hypothetical protein JO257_01695 [Deltaproteobacteria bacterium]|nr:hypothetical protein [Deltaproteobacteria bacterium]